ncbi:hypothetical protein Z042_23305 [Chania multitudinisentens RB-25]|uniref:Insertion element IS150 protein InsJ-like helix-turn-helix domain-containing protein n=1 Tax=Chania multitudinisentens RB-25 TaxID=1441930 RepID=W0LIC2_9GAMM|nr:hypothetical protein Z042_05510 [Chania multitudinisentens RB-25]AHG22204.1 hypothetical protein Z042_23305 [Chania multitudinisentens RB-25]
MRRKYSVKFKVQVAKHYLSRIEGADLTAKRFKIDHGTVRKWAEVYKAHGHDGFETSYHRFSAASKEAIVLDMWENHLSSRQVAAKYKIAPPTASKWEKLYNSGGIDALQGNRKERPPMIKTIKITPKLPSTQSSSFSSEQEELEYLRAENAYLKKLQALIQQENELMQKKKQKS